MKDTASPQEYDQAIFRLCTRNVGNATYTDENGVEQKQKICRKTNVYLIDFKVDRMYNMMVSSAISQCGADKNKQHNIEEVKAIINKNIENEIVTVQPSVWLTGQTKNKNICNIINNIGATIESIKASDHFDAIIAQPMSINYINQLKTQKIIFNGKQYNSCYDIDIISNDEYLNVFKTHINSLLTKNLMTELKAIPGATLARSNYEYNQNENSYIVKAAAIRGHGYAKNKELNPDFYTLISNNDKIVQEYFIGLFKDIKNKKYKGYGLTYYWSFNTKQEAYNFYNYIRTDFCRICLYFSKTSPNLIIGSIIKTIPWFNFNEEIFSKAPAEIDDYLFKKYHISDKIRKHIEELLPDYYNIRKGRD